MTGFFQFPALAAALALSGCVASSATSIVTAPVRVAGKAADLASTSQSEADEKRGREMRKHEEAMARLERAYQKHLRQCDRGQRQACIDARDDYARMQMLKANAPGRR